MNCFLQNIFDNTLFYLELMAVTNSVNAIRSITRRIF